MALELYQFELCPYCAKVRAVLEKRNISYQKIEVAHNREDPQRRELAEKSGVKTVPVLHDKEKWIGESAAIIAYLEENY